MKKRMLIPLALVGLSSLGGTFALAAAPATAADKDMVVAGKANAKCEMPASERPAGPKNTGAANSTIQVCKNGKLVAYGNDAIMYTAPSSKLEKLGAKLYALNCASCHGVKADGEAAKGTTGGFPALTGLGPATINFWIMSGRMPAATPVELQAMRKPAKLTQRQADAIAAWINSLDLSLPYQPKVNVEGANLTEGNEIFALNCAACHTITGNGDALANGTVAPTLHGVPANQIAEAIRTGPGNMPVFAGNLTDEQVRDVVGYVTQVLQKPDTTGGITLGGLGPVAEGFIALALGVGILALIAFWIGDRT